MNCTENIEEKVFDIDRIYDSILKQKEESLEKLKKTLLKKKEIEIRNRIKVLKNVRDRLTLKYKEVVAEATEFPELLLNLQKNYHYIFQKHKEELKEIIREIKRLSVTLERVEYHLKINTNF